MADLSRRALLHGRLKKTTQYIRPPWTTSRSVETHCTRCDACINACPEKILKPDATGLPMIDFSSNGCTFCGDCRDACQEKVFDVEKMLPWSLDISISSQCLPKQGVVCQSCRDACSDQAILAPYRLGGLSSPVISTQHCTSCGMCIAICPVNAITLSPTAVAPSESSS